MSRLCISFVVLALATLDSCGEAPPALAPGLALELRFDDSLAPIATAELAREAPTRGVAFDSGIEGRAARFDGSGAALKLRGLDRLGVDAAMTLEFFVKFEDWINPYGAGSGLESVVSHSDIFTVAVDPHSWKLQARLKTNATSESVRLVGGLVRPNAWHHVALVLDDARGQARLVLDGDVVSDVPVVGAVAIRPNLDLVIGTWFEKNQAFRGALDSVRIWRRALSDEEIRARVAMLSDASSS